MIVFPSSLTTQNTISFDQKNNKKNRATENHETKKRIKKLKKIKLNDIN